MKRKSSSTKIDGHSRKLDLSHVVKVKTVTTEHKIQGGQRGFRGAKEKRD